MNLPADVQRQNTLSRVAKEAERMERHARAWETAANRCERLVINGGDDPDVAECIKHMVILARREANEYRKAQDKYEERADGIRQRLAVQG